MVNPEAPNVSFAPFNEAKATAQVDGSGAISSIVIDYNGSGYNFTPTVLIEGDGSGATAVADLNITSGTIDSITITAGGTGYSYANITILGGLEKSSTPPEIVLGESIKLGVSAWDNDGQVVEIMLIKDGDKNNPLVATQNIQDPILQPGSFRYDGAEPNYKIYYTPSALGFVELMVAARDDAGRITYGNPVSYRVTNGEPPVVEMVAPHHNSEWGIGFGQNPPITLVARAYDPDWAFNNNVQELSRINGVSFFANNRFIGEGTQIPGTDLYTAEWNATVAGTYEIVAVAVDSQGGTLIDGNPTVDLPNVGDNRGNTAVSTPITCICTPEPRASCLSWSWDFPAQIILTSAPPHYPRFVWRPMPAIPTAAWREFSSM